MFDKKDIAKVRSSEISRGEKTPRGLRQKEERLKALLMRALEMANRELFEETLIELGQPIDSEQHRASMRIFDEYEANK
jgi:hypothetical protein